MEDRLAKIIKTVILVLEADGVPKYSSVKSKRTYSDHSKIGLLVLRQYLNVSYEEFSAVLASMKCVMRIAGIRGVPDPSTLRKFAKRVEPRVLGRTLGSVADLVCIPEMTVAVDAAGFSVSRASMHYLKRMDDFGKGIDVRSPKTFTKATFAVDTDTLTIIACKVSGGNVHDVRHVPDIVDDIRRGGFDVKNVVADKGYDSERVHECIRAGLGADTIIPVRDMTGPPFKGKRKKLPHGKNRKRMALSFPKDVYPQRNLAETVNSIVKRVFGGSVRSILDDTRVVEVQCRCIAHNFRRLFKLGVL